MTRILVTVLAGGVLAGILGWLLLPVLRALKAGQSIREVGPTWHNKHVLLWRCVAELWAGAAPLAAV